MSYRKLAAAIACAALAVAGLAGCESKVGTAAVVGGHRISDSDVSAYLTPQATPFTVQSSSGSAQTIVPRSYALSAIIREQLFTQALAKTKGGVPDESELASAEEQLTQGASEAAQEKQYTQYGFKASFAAVDLRDTALEAILAQRVGATTDAGPLLKAIDELHVAISVSGRYGTWKQDQLGLSSGPADGAPDFVQLHSATYADQAPAAPAS